MGDAETALTWTELRTRPAHPWAWWGWALGVAAAVSVGTNPLVTLLIAFAVTTVVLLRRTDDPWARSVGAYFALAGFVLIMRLAFTAVLGGSVGPTVLFTLPEVPLPEWAAGIRLGGAVTAEPLAYAAYDSLRLGVMLLCLGAANALANPRRALRAVPAALYEASVAIVIALSVAPQLVESAGRIRRAQRLRGGAGTGLGAVTAVAIPVLADAIDRSLALAAGMEARGFGRTRSAARPSSAGTLGLVAAAMLATFGGFWLLAGGSASARAVGASCIAVGAFGVAVGLRAAGRRLRVTRYRPDRWTVRDSALVAVGIAAGAVAAVASSPLFPRSAAMLNPSTDPLTWPSLGLAAAPLVLGALAPLLLTAPPEAWGGRR